MKEVPDKKALFAALFRTSGDAIIFGDQERRLTLVNPGFTKMFGYSPEEVRGKKTVVLYGSPEEFERQGKLRYSLSAEEKLKPYEVQYCRQNGELYVDAIYDAGDGGGMSGLNIAEYLGLKPNVIDTTGVGGSSYEFHAAHAKRDIAAGKARVGLLTYGSTAHSNAFAIGVGGRGPKRGPYQQPQ